MNENLSTVAHYLVKPCNVVKSKAGIVLKLLEIGGINLYPWQKGATSLALALNAQGKYACASNGVIISSPRQIGKTFLVMCMCWGLMLEQKTTVFWSAHHCDAMNNAFETVEDFATKEAYKSFVKRIHRANGKQGVDLMNGSRIVFRARESGGGVGVSGVDIVVFDEAQCMTTRAIEAVKPTQRVSPNPLTFFLGTPARPYEPHEIFKAKREKALRVYNSSRPTYKGMYVEFSADRNDDPSSSETWAKANPNFEIVGAETFENDYETLPLTSFLREDLGIWDEQSLTPTALDLNAWYAPECCVTCMPKNINEENSVLGVDVAHDKSFCSVILATKQANGNVFMRLVAHTAYSAQGIDSVINLLEEHEDLLTVIDSKSIMSTYSPELDSSGIDYITTSFKDFTASCSRLVDFCGDKKITHLKETEQGVPELYRAVENCEQRYVGKTGLYGFQKINPENEDISPVNAMALALFGLQYLEQHNDSDDYATIL